MDVVKIRLQRQAKPLAQGECFLYSNGLMQHVCVCRPTSTSQNGFNAKCEWFNRPGHFSGMSGILKPKFISEALDAFVKIARSEGLLSLWSGLSPTMLSAVPATVFYFTLYERILAVLRRRMGDKFYAPLISGALARATAVTVVSPLELVRTKMQSQRHTYAELKHAIQTTVAHNGYGALWRGWAATMLREIPFSATYWTCYEWFKHRILKQLGRTQTSVPISLLCGASAGSIAVVLTMPADVVKTQQQIALGVEPNTAQTRQLPLSVLKPKPLLSVARDLVNSGGVSSLFTGIAEISVLPCYIPTICRESFRHSPKIGQSRAVVCHHDREL